MKKFKNLLKHVMGLKTYILLRDSKIIVSIKLLKFLEFCNIFIFSDPYKQAYSHGNDKNFKNISNFINYKNGTYFEIGALNGFFSSPTYNLSVRKNWKGIMVDGNNEFFNLIRLYRPKDEIIHAACSSKENSLKSNNCNFINLHHSGEIYLSDEQIDIYSKNKLKELGNDIVRNNIPLTTVTDIIDSSKIVNNFNLDLMVIDVEGHEMEVLSGYDFSKVNTKFFLIESRTSEEQNLVNIFLEKNKYKCIGQTSSTDFLYEKL